MNEQTPVRVKMREWPLVLGLVVSGGLVFASTQIHTDLPSAKSTSPAVKTAADIAPTAQAAAPAPAAAAAPAHPKKAKAHRAPAAKPPHHAKKAATATPAATPSTPAPKPATKKTPHHSTGGTSAPSNPSLADGSILNVPGTSGQATVGGVDFGLSAPSHKPVANQPWLLEATAKSAGKKLSGDVRVDVIHDGQIVGHIDSGVLKNGVYRKKIKWPDQADGYALTVKVVLDAGPSHVSFLYDVTVQK